MKPKRILIVEDEKSQAQLLADVLKKYGYAANFCHDIERAKGKVPEVDIVLVDYKLGKRSGMELIGWIRENDIPVGIIMITAFGSIDLAVEAVKRGADDFLSKPINADELSLRLEKVYEKISLKKEVEYLRDKFSLTESLEDFPFRSANMKTVIKLIEKAAETDANVLITGETGTGKERVAELIHMHSKRRNGPFVRVNICAIPETLLESELFGAEKGAYTGADRRMIGKFEEANGGTLLLDEIADLPLGSQVKLLRAVQNKKIMRLGSSKEIEVNVRIIATTNKNIEEEVYQGRFREDLYYRLNVLRIFIPPLRDRTEDIVVLVNYFIKKFSKREGKQIEGITRDAMEKLLNYNYPGNVRELENIMERAIIITNDNQIKEKEIILDFSIKKEEIVEGKSLVQLLEEREKEIILRALNKCNWVKTKAAEMLKISERKLRYRMERLGIE